MYGTFSPAFQVIISFKSDGILVEDVASVVGTTAITSSRAGLFELLVVLVLLVEKEEDTRVFSFSSSSSSLIT